MSYAVVLRTPHAARTFGAALLGRLSYGTISLSLVLAVKEATGSLALAGTAAAVFGGTSVCLSPARAALVDRYGLRGALLPMTALYAVLLAGLAVITRYPGAPVPLLLAFAVVSGACTPPLGPVMRTLWGVLFPDRRMLQRAYGLDGVAEELLFVGGPLLVGVLVMYGPPAAGIALSGGLALVGTLALISSPVVFPSFGRGGTTTSRRAGKGFSGLGQPVTAAVGVGLCLGALDLLVVAFTEDRRQPGAVSWVLAALSAGSAAGGLVNGAVTWRIPARRRLRLLSVALGLATVAAGFAPGVYGLGAAAALAGLFVAPALTTAYLIADEAAAPDARTRAGAWVNTAMNGGTSAGTAAVGLLVGGLPLTLCFALAGLPLLLSATAGVRRTGAPAGQEAARAAGLAGTGPPVRG